jgi:hypothetical protein
MNPGVPVAVGAESASAPMQGGGMLVERAVETQGVPMVQSEVQPDEMSPAENIQEADKIFEIAKNEGSDVAFDALAGEEGVIDGNVVDLSEASIEDVSVTSEGDVVNNSEVVGPEEISHSEKTGAKTAEESREDVYQRRPGEKIADLEEKVNKIMEQNKEFESAFSLSGLRSGGVNKELLIRLLLQELQNGNDEPEEKITIWKLLLRILFDMVKGTFKESAHEVGRGVSEAA